MVVTLLMMLVRLLLKQMVGYNGANSVQFGGRKQHNDAECFCPLFCMAVKIIYDYRTKI